MCRLRPRYRFKDRFDAEVCPLCGEMLFTEEASDAIDAQAKRLGLWGEPRPVRMRKPRA
jgi:hypothetical protein